jgi:hypothetical protein
MPVTVSSSRTSTTSASATASTSHPTGHRKSTACKFPEKKCVNPPFSPCVQRYAAFSESFSESPPGLDPSGNPNASGCSSSGAGCVDQSCTSLSISAVTSARRAACMMVRGGRVMMNVTHSRSTPSAFTVRPGACGVPSARSTGWSYTVTYATRALPEAFTTDRMPDSGSTARSGNTASVS